MNKPAAAAKKSNWYRRLPVNAQATIIVSVVLFIIFVLPFLVMFALNPGPIDSNQYLSTVPFPPTKVIAREDIPFFRTNDTIICAQIIDENDAQSFEAAIKQAPEWKPVSSLSPDLTVWLYGENGTLHRRHQKVLYPHGGYYVYKHRDRENELLENNYAFNEGKNRLENMEYMQYDPATQELTLVSRG